MMSMFDCIKCWETPCACGHEYQLWTEQRLREQTAMLQRVLDSKTAKTNLGENNDH